MSAIYRHNYRLEVTVAGEVDPRTGFFGNVLDLKGLVDQLITDPCEHYYLNDVPVFEASSPRWKASEPYLAILEQPLADQSMELHEILLAETDDNVVRLRRE